MKALQYIGLGILFGIVMIKSEAASWYRIQEMFRFQSFHMYGIIGVAVVLGILVVQFIKRSGMRDTEGNRIMFISHATSIPRYLFGGTIFGFGWALTGACPGPMVVNMGYGYTVSIIVIAGAILGTYIYGILQDKLPH